MNRPAFQRSIRRENPSAAEGGGFEPPVREPVRQFSKLLVSATHPSFRISSAANRGVISLIAGAKVQLFFEPCKFLGDFYHFSIGFSPSATVSGCLRERITGLEPATLGLGSQCSTNWAKSASEEKRSQTCRGWLPWKSEPIAGLEPATHALRMRCSTNWAISAAFQRSRFRSRFFRMRLQRYNFFL